MNVVIGSCSRIGLAAVVLTVGVHAQIESVTDPQLRAGESVVEVDAAFPGAGPVDADGEEEIWPVQIVDAFDGRAIAGALVQVPWHTWRGVVAAERHFQCVGRADPEGWVRLPWAALGGAHEYSFADAPGYSAYEYCGPGEDQCELRRGVDVPIRVVDYLGRSVPDARVELVLGCAHVPPQRVGITDAEGVAVLPDIDPTRHEDFLVWAEGCHCGAYDLRGTWREGSPPVVIDVVPGLTLRGRVLDAGGKPVRGALVGAVQGDRELACPWDRTGADGRFELLGLSPHAELECRGPAWLSAEPLRFEAPPVGVEREIVLGRIERDAPLELRVEGEAGEAVEEVVVTAVRRADGHSVTRRTDSAGHAEFSLPPGAYRVLVDGGLGVWGDAEAAVDVTATALATARVVVQRNPTVRVDVRAARDWTLGVTTAQRYRRLVFWDEDVVDVPVPRAEQAAIRVSGRFEAELAVRFFPVPEPGGSIVLEPPASVVVRADFVDHRDEPVAGCLWLTREFFGGETWEEGPYETESSCETWMSGPVSWIAVPERDDLEPVFGDLDLQGEDVDLGTVQFPGKTAPVRLAVPEEFRNDWSSVRQLSPRGREVSEGLIEPDGRVEGLGVVRPGNMLKIWLSDPEWYGFGERRREEFVLPFRHLVTGAAVQTISWPRGSLRLRVRDGLGRPIEEPVVCFDTDWITWEEPEGPDGTVIRAIQPGRHTLVVGAAGHRAKVYELRFGEEDEERELTVVLSPRK